MQGVVMTPALGRGWLRLPAWCAKKGSSFPKFFCHCPECLYLVEWWKLDCLYNLKQTLYKTSPWPCLHQDHPGNFTKENLKTGAQGSPRCCFQSPSTTALLSQRSPPSRSPAAVGHTPGGQAASGTRLFSALARDEGGLGVTFPICGILPHSGHVGAPQERVNHSQPRFFTIYSQSEHEATAGSLESPAPAPGAPSLALAFSIFLSFPLSLGSSQRG